MAAPRDDTAQQLARGVGRLLGHLGYDSLTEFTLRSGRRADLAGIDRKGRIAIVEIKSSVADFRADQKWPEYLDYCDLFYFAVPLDFPVEILPDEPGLIPVISRGPRPKTQNPCMPAGGGRSPCVLPAPPPSVSDVGKIRGRRFSKAMAEQKMENRQAGDNPQYIQSRIKEMRRSVKGQQLQSFRRHRESDKI